MKHRYGDSNPGFRTENWSGAVRWGPLSSVRSDERVSDHAKAGRFGTWFGTRTELLVSSSARPGRWWDLQVLADLAYQPDSDFSVAWHRGRAVRVHPPEAVATTLSKQSRAVSSQVSFQVAALHAVS